MLDKSSFEELLKERETRFWGFDYKITPAFVETVLGDGERLLGFQPLATRPDFYVIRVDSKWATSFEDEATDTVYDHTDEIEEAIEDEFGNGYNEDETEYGEPFPALHDGCGSLWFDMTKQIKAKAANQ